MSNARLPLLGLLTMGMGVLLQFGAAPGFPHQANPIWMTTRGDDTRPGISQAATQQRLEAYGKLPLSFEVNQGQADTEVDFLSRGRGYALFLTPTEVGLSLIWPQIASRIRPTISSSFSSSTSSAVHARPESAALRMKLVGANPHATKTGLEELPGKVNYLLGDDPAGWHTNIATYAKVEYQDVYPGVDVVYYGNQRQLEYDLVLAPGVDPDGITLDFEGADKLKIDARGDLVLQTAGEPVLQLHKPFVYQEIDGVRQEISGGYVLEKHRVSFQIGTYDTARSLVIDPVFVYATRLGSSNDAAGYAIAVDSASNVYVTGDTLSTDFPLAKPLQRASGGAADVFVAKLSADGSKLLYSTYLGGSDGDVGCGIAVDLAGNVYVTGDTLSTDFPLANPLQRASAGAADVFVTKLNADGSKLLYSTYLGGSDGDKGQGIGVDIFGNAYVTGYTNSTDFPTANAVQGAFAGGNSDAFVLKLNPSGSALIYSTYLGGGNDRPDSGTAIAVDSAGCAYVTGFTNSSDFPTVKPLQPFRGPTDVFVAKLNPSGSALIYSTHLGGGADDEGMGIAVDASGNAYVTGHTESLNFPTTAGALSTGCVAIPVPIPIGNICSGGDAFISKVSPDGSTLVYSTYLNGRSFEVGRSIAVDSAGSAYVTGFTGSPDFPAVNPVQKAFGGGDYDAFVVKLNPNGSALTYSTYLGGSGDDGGYGIAVDRAGNAYVTGFTGSPDFPTRNPIRNTVRRASRGSRDIFVVKIAEKEAGSR